MEYVSPQCGKKYHKVKERKEVGYLTYDKQSRTAIHIFTECGLELADFHPASKKRPKDRECCARCERKK